MDKLVINNKKIELPAFFPDATYGCIKGVSPDDLKNENISNVVINTYHLLSGNNIGTVKKVGGIHKYSGIPGIIITDSGGFQAMSLVRRNKKMGKIDSGGIHFKSSNGQKDIYLTPEKCIKTQIDLKSDIVMCLDDCTNPEESKDKQTESVERTINWASECKYFFNKYTRNLKNKPLLFSIIQGGNFKDLRKKCADALIGIGFDGYAYGGWPVDKNRIFLSSIVKYTAELIPDNKPKYAMGVGKPEDIKKCFGYGYNMFDCVLPTRDARHQRLYVFKNSSYEYIHIGNQKYKNDIKPISNNCGCYTCRNYSRYFLYNLFKNKDPLAIRLATIHNLRFYSDLMIKLKQLKIS